MTATSADALADDAVTVLTAIRAATTGSDDGIPEALAPMLAEIIADTERLGRLLGLLGGLSVTLLYSRHGDDWPAAAVAVRRYAAASTS